MLIVPGLPDQLPILAKTTAGLVVAAWPRMLDLQMAALYLGISAKTIRNHRHKLPGMRKWGDKIVFDRHALDRMIDRSQGMRSLWVDAEKEIK